MVLWFFFSFFFIFPFNYCDFKIILEVLWNFCDSRLWSCRSSWFCSAYSDLRPIDHAHPSCSVGFLRAGSKPTTTILQSLTMSDNVFCDFFLLKPVLLTRFLFPILCRELDSRAAQECLAEYKNRIHKLAKSESIYFLLIWSRLLNLLPSL